MSQMIHFVVKHHDCVMRGNRKVQRQMDNLWLEMHQFISQTLILAGTCLVDLAITCYAILVEISDLQFLKYSPVTLT